MTYACDQCGACCRKLLIEITEIDLVREPKLLPVLRGRFRSGGGLLAACKPCPMLYENKCTIYETRPTVCAEFPPGGEQCQDARERDGLPRLLETEE